jgi:hypothetical protein
MVTPTIIQVVEAEVIGTTALASSLMEVLAAVEPVELLMHLLQA